MGCGASIEDSLKGMTGGGGADSDATKQLAPITFTPLGLASFDSVFTLCSGCFDTLLQCNRKVYDLVTSLMNSTGKLNLLDAIKEAVIQARAVIDPYMPDDIAAIRESIQSAPAEAVTKIAGVLTDLKDLIPDIDTANLSSGDLKLTMPKMAMDKCPGAAKQMMQMVIDLAQALVACATDGIKSMIPRMETCMAQVSDLSIGKLTDEMKSSGMGMGEMMSKPGELQANLAQTPKLQEYGQVILGQVTVVATGLSGGYKAGVEFIVENAPQLSMQGGTAQAEIKNSVKLAA